MKIMRSILILSLCCFTNLLPAQYFQHRIDSNINTMRIDSVGKIISELRNYNPNGNNRYLSYWEAYALYKCSILSSIMKKKEDAKKFTEKAIEILESIKGKTTEDYALLGMLKNYQINFSGWLATIKLSNQAKSMAQKAIELDGDNLRAYLVLGINNYYTPEFYGGKVNVKNISRKPYLFRIAHQVMNLTRPGGERMLSIFCWHIIRDEKTSGTKNFLKN